MRRVRTTVWAVLAVGLIVGLSGTALAQTPVTTGEIDRLDAATALIEKQAGTLRATDPTLAVEIGKSLTLLKEDVIFMRVTVRRGGTVTREEYVQVRDRIETLRVKSLGQKVAAQPIMEDEPMTPSGRVWVVPVGTEIDVRLQTWLNSATAKLEQRFEATTLLDVKLGQDVVLPAGTVVRGFVGSVRAAGRVERRGSLTLAFDEVLLARGPTRLRASVTQALDGKSSEDMSRIGTGAVVGAILGGLLGGGKGLLVGVLVGGGGTIAATDGTDADLPLGTILRLRIDSPLDIR
jgi:hypothetical protein